jgi:hypothetical protein
MGLLFKIRFTTTTAKNGKHLCVNIRSTMVQIDTAVVAIVRPTATATVTATIMLLLQSTVTVVYSSRTISSVILIEWEKRAAAPLMSFLSTINNPFCSSSSGGVPPQSQPQQQHMGNNICESSNTSCCSTTTTLDYLYLTFLDMAFVGCWCWWRRKVVTNDTLYDDDDETRDQQQYGFDTVLNVWCVHPSLCGTTLGNTFASSWRRRRKDKIVLFFTTTNYNNNSHMRSQPQQRQVKDQQQSIHPHTSCEWSIIRLCKSLFLFFAAADE